ncbi:hypothetical protein PV328_009512 [Microctonus aethiopoides]|uniref:Dystroglycan-type cadherin-like domain-containing protein n=1 Tax=Microctonus aethiopoides TaxID=144406 RepID=A0AA39C682_9HYME|nr:hypothetical protein PV328_009512 [Microctonus aethiopoides]
MYFQRILCTWVINYYEMLLSLLILFVVCGSSLSEVIVTSSVFVIPIGPEMFNWNSNAGRIEFTYQASLINAPDLPSWIHYTYSDKHRRGFLYGVPPNDQGDFKLEIVGLNKQTYDTAYKIIDIKVQKKENITKSEVYLKIDNLDIEDTFDGKRMEKLFDVFRKELWTEAQDLHLTFLASAVEEGARLPLDPKEAEGVVLRLGSSMPFSHSLNDYEAQLKPLRRRLPCPKDFKRTSKEIMFRNAGFVLDWCSFKLISENRSLHQESARRDPGINIIGRTPLVATEHAEWQWARPKKIEIPTRNYFHEIATTVCVPTLLLLILAVLLSSTLCLHHEKARDPESDKYFNELFNIYYKREKNKCNEPNIRPKKEPSPVEETEKISVQMVQYATTTRGTLRSLSAQPSSPNELLLRSPRANFDAPVERTNSYLRPNPPPYNSSNIVGSSRVDF